MKQLLLALVLLLPFSAHAAPTTWDYTSSILQPLQSMWAAMVKGSYFVSTSTTAINVFPNARITNGTTTNATTTGSQYFASGAVAASSVLRTDSNGKLSAVTVGTNLSFDGTTLSATAGSGLATSSPISSSNLLVYSTSGAGSAYGAATTTLTITGPFTNSATPIVLGASPITSTYTGLSTTTALTGGQVLYSTNGAAGVSSAATTTLSGNSQIALSQPVNVLGGSASVLSIVADSIGDTQLAFNTGQALTSASSPTFAGLTLTGLNGPLDARAGVVGATTSIGVLYGGTGTTTNRYGGIIFGDGTKLTQASTTGILDYNPTTRNTIVQYGSSTAFTATNLYAASLTGLLKGTSGLVSAATAGTDYVAGGTGANTQVAYFTAAGTIAGDAGNTYNATLDRETTTYSSSTAVSATNANYSGILTTARAIISGIAAAFTPSVSGEIGFDTTPFSDLKWYDGTTVRVNPSLYYIRFNYSTTTTFTATSSDQYLGPAPRAITLQYSRCETDASFVSMQIGDGTNYTNYQVASTTIGTTTLSSNNTFIQGETMRARFGTTTSATTKQIACTVAYTFNSI